MFIVLGNYLNVLTLISFSFLRFIYLFYVYEYTVAVFRHTRRGHQIPFQMVVSCGLLGIEPGPQAH